MKKILMLLPLLVLLSGLVGCSKSEDMTSPPAANADRYGTNNAATNTPPK
jgi:hypothetical protein